MTWIAEGAALGLAVPCAVIAGVGLTATPSVGSATVWTATRDPLAGKCPHSCPLADQRPGIPASGPPRSTNSEVRPQRSTTAFQPKGPRPLLVTEKTWVDLWTHISPGKQWISVDSSGSLHSHTSGLCGWGRRPPSDTRNPGKWTGPWAIVYMGTLQAVLWNPGPLQRPGMGPRWD